MGASFGDAHDEGKRHTVGSRADIVSSEVAAPLLTTECGTGALSDVYPKEILDKDEVPARTREKNTAHVRDLGCR